jgi:predicted acylesterase/phospholipase RssA
MAKDNQQKKLGLALSGGGLRASYFHIGVLAQMAEQGLLRHVEVISTVSGGSIIGALYYLQVKKLLESKPDAEISNQDYINIVRAIETDFKTATDKNIRMSTFANFTSNLKMAKANYSRSDRISELYNDWIYQAVLTKTSNPVQMRELKIFPPGEPDFHPHTGNAGRKAKVPILNINSTTLNTGRAWQFTAQTMGEPIAEDDDGAPVSEETDSKSDRYRRARPSYDNMAPHQQDFGLGHAVGASAGVPGLFPPLSISGLYQDGDQSIRVQLVDGGIYDNQGIDALLREECTDFVISDASAQLVVESEPRTDTIPVLTRTADCITADRIRTETLKRLFKAYGREKIAFMHLRKGLGVQEIPWIDNTNAPSGPVRSLPPTSKQFGVDPEVQDLLSQVRTDLDAFSEVEAYSLILDGYLMSSAELKAFQSHAGYGAPEAEKPAPLPQAAGWKFLSIASKINAPTPDYLKQLQVSHLRFGKPLMLIPPLAVLAIGAAVLLLWMLWPLLSQWLHTPITLNVIVMPITIVVIYNYLAKWERMFKFVKGLRLFGDAVKRWLLNVLPALIGMPFIWFYLKFINPLYLWRGRVDNLDLTPQERWRSFRKWLKSGLA